MLRSVDKWLPERHLALFGPGFRHFMLRGLDQVRGGRTRVTMAWNIKRLFVLTVAS